jgi:UDP-glucose 4-epimerase
MTDPQTVLVTGVGGFWGARLAAQLTAETDLHVLGIDATAPANPVKGLDFIQADARNSLLVELLRDEGVTTVCHLWFIEADRHSETNFDLNVIGSMKVFGACAQAGVRKVILKSSTAVYGASPANPAFLTEGHPLNGSRRTGTLRHLLEIEAFCNGFRGQAPGMTITTLRFANIVGPTADTPMTRFLSTPATPRLLGFDPMLQVIHEDDVIGALAHAVTHDAPGVFNVAAEEPMPLSRLTALADKVAMPIFHLAVYWGNPLLSGVGVPVKRLWPIEPDYLRYGWVGDLAQMRGMLGFTPQYTGPEAVRAFTARQRIARYVPASRDLVKDEELLGDTLERRRRAKASSAQATPAHPCPPAELPPAQAEAVAPIEDADETDETEVRAEEVML